MASVFLDFVPPSEPEITELRIYEGTTQSGVFNLIETVTDVGDYPNYISSYTTENAASRLNWFSIEWVDSKGADSGLSAAVRGDTRSVVADIVQRVMLRMPFVQEQIAFEEAEAVVEEVCGTAYPDPATVTKKQLSGITLITLARVLVTDVSLSGVEGSTWVAGIVSMKADSSVKVDPSELLKMAAKILGLSQSRVLQISEVPVGGGFRSIVAFDVSRSIIELQ